MKVIKKFLLCLLGVSFVVLIISFFVFMEFGENVLKILAAISGVYLFVYCKWVFKN